MIRSRINFAIWISLFWWRKDVCWFLYFSQQENIKSLHKYVHFIFFQWNNNHYTQTNKKRLDLKVKSQVFLLISLFLFYIHISFYSIFSNLKINTINRLYWLYWLFDSTCWMRIFYFYIWTCVRSITVNIVNNLKRLELIIK